MCHARRKAQEYSESLSSIFNEAWREKIPFEAVYPYADVPKGAFFYSGIMPNIAANIMHSIEKPHTYRKLALI